MRFIARMPSDQAKGIIIEQLKDEDNSVKGEAVRLLGELKCRESVPTLIGVLGNSRTSYELKEEICVALAAIGVSDALPALVNALKPKNGWLFSKPKPELDRVRMRAAWALRKFCGPDAIKALEAASTDKVVSVALTAKESLAVIKQPKV
jgi:HEAT repeat protein